VENITYQPQPPGLHIQPLPPRKPSTAWKAVKWIGFLVVVLICVASVFFNVILSAGLVGISGGAAAPERVIERHISGPSGMSAASRVAVITVEGVITGTEDTGPSRWILAQIKRAREDKKVRAVLLDVDSPGGGITASDVAYNRILDLKKANKKVIVLMRDLAASGAYYISAPADEIFAHPTTLTGSIGVVIYGFTIEGLFQKIGVESVVYKSGPYKDILSPYRPATEEEKKMLQGITDQMFSRFKDIVAQGRKLTPEETDAVSTGAIFTAQEAKDRKLIDQIGYYEDAVAAARSAAGGAGVEVVKYERPPTLADILFSSQTDASKDLQAELARLIAERKPGLYYIWPGP